MVKKPTANNRLHQLLGLRLRFCLRGKYSDIFNFIFQINLVDLFWPVFAAATDAKRQTLVVIIPQTQESKSNFKSKNIRYKT